MYNVHKCRMIKWMYHHVSEWECSHVVCMIAQDWHWCLCDPWQAPQNSLPEHSQTNAGAPIHTWNLLTNPGISFILIFIFFLKNFQISLAPALCEQSAKQAMTNIDIMTDDNWLFWSLKLWGSLEAVNGGHPARVHKVQQRANDGDVRELRTKRVSHGFTNHCMVLKQIPLSSYPLCDIETYWRSLRGCGSMMFYDVLCLRIYWYSESSHLASKPTQHEEWVAHRRNMAQHTHLRSHERRSLFMNAKSDYLMVDWRHHSAIPS